MSMIKYSIVLTVHNKDFLLDKVFSGILNNTTGEYELIIVLDGCTDNSKYLAQKLLLTETGPSIRIIETPDVFETRANNAGLRMARGEYAIIVQDDMVIKEHGWNERMSKPCEKWDDIFAVTARCAHNWRYNPGSADIRTEEIRNDRWCDILNHCDHATRDNTPRDIFRMRQSVNRGPLLLSMDIVKKLGYLDERINRQDMDDHMLCFKAYKEFGMKAGIYWIDYESKREWGSTIDENQQPKSWLLESNQKNMRLFYRENKDRLDNYDIYNEDRYLQ